MSKGSFNIIAVGLLAVFIAYVLFYTPVYKIIFTEIQDVKTAKNILPTQKKAPRTSLIIGNRSKSKKNKIEKPGIRFLQDPFSVEFVFEQAITSESAATKEAAEKKSYLLLQGIFVLSDGSTVALIDDKLYSEGDNIYGWNISRIYPDRVVIQKNSKTKTLRLKWGVFSWKNYLLAALAY